MVHTPEVSFCQPASSLSVETFPPQAHRHNVLINIQYFFINYYCLVYFYLELGTSLTSFPLVIVKFNT